MPATYNPANNQANGAWSYHSRGDQVVDGGPDNQRLAYDGESRITAVCPSAVLLSSCPYDSTSWDARYLYDVPGRRVRKDLKTSGSTYYVYDASGVLQVEDGGPAVPAPTEYLMVDHLGSTRVVTDGSGTAVSRLDYEPFGRELPVTTASWRNGVVGYSGTRPTQRFTGKERDAETGLDYFGARYMASAQGRFTSPDPLLASGQAPDPQSWNRYAYVRNNPLRRIDPDGKYDRDVHLDLTFALAEAAGYGSDTAMDIAMADHGVDTNPRTEPFAGEQARADWHFPTAERVSQLASTTAANLNPTSLGQYLHVYQDSFSHAGYGTKIGHLLDGHKPDITANRPGLANRMAEGTYANLTAATGGIKAIYAATPWSRVASHVDRFNRARTDKGKQAALRGLRKEVDKYRKEAAEAERKRREEEERSRSGSPQ